MPAVLALMYPQADGVLMGLADLLALGAAVVVAVFWVIYGSLFNWRKTEPGKALFWFLSALLAILALAVFTRLIGGTDFYGRSIVRVIVYGYGFFTSLRLLRALFQQYRRTGQLIELERKARHDDNEMETTP